MKDRFVTQIVDSLSDALITIDKKRIIVSWNKMAETIFGYQKSEIETLGFEVIIPPAYLERHRSAYNRFMENVESRSSYVSEVKELEGVRKNGEIFPMELTHSLLKVNDQEFYVTAIIRDLSLHSRYRLMRNRLDRITRHDLKNKLIIASLSARRLAEVPAVVNEPRAMRYLDILRGELNKSTQMLDSTRELILLETGEYHRKEDQVDLVELLSGVRDAMQTLAATKHIVVQVLNHLGGANPVLTADRQLMERVLENLVKNAIEAEDAGGEVKLALELDAKGALALEVCNGGKPIPPKVQSEIFQPYVTHGKKGGTGLGLYSAKLILEKVHGWKLSYRSDQSGTVFRIDF
ncbi:MAG: PAS domain S-box protein [Deltaproteobacteria bacterium]|nr:PAS domain S-box protein [Deltaproteobacteria bacterium]